MMNGVKWMNATQMNDVIYELKQNIYDEIHHRILWKYTDKPVLKDEQLFFLLLPFLNGVNYDETMKKNVISVGIVHASLDEHEKIKETSSNDKVQQLTVLSGDYYSGLYYEMLAKGGNISLIQALSSGIINRCEQQIKVYEPEILTMERFATLVEVVESELITQFYTTIEQSQYNAIAKCALTIIELQKMMSQDAKSNLKTIFARVQKEGTNILELQQLIEVRKQHLQQLLTDSNLNEECMRTIEKYCLS
jgi:heptaprenyl diphosphate synthase